MAARVVVLANAVGRGQWRLGDVPLETWLTAMHPDAETIVPAVEETMDMEQATIDAIDSDLAETNSERNEKRADEEPRYAESLKEIVAAETKRLRDEWDEMIGANDHRSAGLGIGDF